MKLKKFNESKEYKDIKLIPVLDAAEFPEDVTNELVTYDISTHYQNDVMYLDWDNADFIELERWLINKYGPTIRDYNYFAILST